MIGSLRHLDEAMERFVSTPFFVKFNCRAVLYYPVARGDHGTPYALFYEEALFLNYIVKHWKFNTSRLSKFELEDYNLAVKKLQDCTTSSLSARKSRTLSGKSSAPSTSAESLTRPCRVFFGIPDFRK